MNNNWYKMNELPVKKEAGARSMLKFDLAVKLGVFEIACRLAKIR